MLRKLTVDQINDWFTIGKTVTDVELLGSPPAFPAEAARDEAQRRDAPPRFGPAAGAQTGPQPAASGRPLSRKSSEMEYIDKYRQLEAQEFDMYGSDQSTSRPGPRPSLAKLSNVACVPETTYKYPDLPINRCKDEVISLIESNSVVIIHGATGSGKSTQLPQYILDHYVQRSAYCNIVVTQPRKIGATSIARWISKERAWTLGGLVGYQVGLEKIATEDTKLIYMTTGVLLQKIVSAKSLVEFTHIFVDEVHERTEEMDFLLLVVRKLLRTNSRFVKIILMSATISCKEFADYFAVPVQNKMNPAYVFEVEGKPHSIEEYYLDDLGHIHHGRLSPHILEEPVITKDIYEVAVSLIQMFDNLDVKESGSKSSSGAQFVAERSSVLVFLPGLGEINYMHELLTNMVHKRLQVYPLHSSVTLEEQNNVFLSPVPGYRKIILSTNIAESSITVPDVKYVIDFCLTRTLVCDEDTNYQSLRLSWASKTSCNQRKGRAGRVSKGRCYRLIHRDFWDSSIPDHVVPEMLRCPLGSTILKVKLLDMGEPRALLATALSPPGLGDIERTILLLKEVGALAVSGQREDENPHDGELTFLGRVLAQLPVNQQLGKLIVLGHVFGCLDECLIIAAALSLKNFFAMPFRQHLDGYRYLASPFQVPDELIFSLRLWSRAFVEFSRNPTERFKTLPAVYMAMKMSQLKVALELNVHSAEEIEGKVQGGAVSKLRNTRVNVDFQKQTVDPMQVSFNTFDRSQTITDLLLTIDVTEVVEVGHFWGYRVDERTSKILRKLTAEINRLKLVPLPMHPHPDLVCLAPFTDFDQESYFRAQILYVSGNSAEVFFVDYGNRSHVDLDLLMEIPCQLLELPFQALELKIRGMRPSAKSLVCGEHWSREAGRRFASLVTGRALLVRVFSVVHGVLHVDVYRCAGAQDAVSVRDVLIREGYAELAEEPYESRQSHEALKGLFSKSVEDIADMSVPSPVKDDKKYLIRILLESFSSNKLGAPSCKAMLHGPFNPYELKCHSLTRISKFRCVWIEKESINSVVISDAPEDLHQRMLVAASLSVNATGSTMLLRETSLMPHIPGLPALLSVLFAPAMELRVDRDGKNYTGVLCGLGWNPTTGAPILPEHDIELAFDVQFNVEDIIEINILRAAVNKLVCDGPNGSKFLGPERIAQLQDSARQKLLGLFCQSKPRQRIVPTWHEKPYEWNQVDPKLVMEQADRESDRGKNTFLYQLHKLIVLSA
uniref:ATP-dependent RNA helicase TDRD9 n=1 Tax=Panthera onca TaxID=9690 RepID=UPI0029529E25|nr:ATP-dependent RNA helicase TDRD9 [Panthera onca]